VQEVLNNALKHAKAKNIMVTLHYFSTTFELSIKDNGKGFDTQNIKPETMASSGAGLRNMQRRMELIGGKCRINSSIGEGTEVCLQL
jgi:signal transduction histidine kinase